MHDAKSQAIPSVGKPPFKALLLDVYGVLEFKGAPCEGAIDFIDTLNKRGIPYRLLTNSTLQSRKSMAEKLQKLGFAVQPEHMITASSATAQWLVTQKAQSCRVIIDGKGLEEFTILPDNCLMDGLISGKVLTEDTTPEYIVLGDARDGFTFANINVLYRQLKAGATLVMMIPNVTSIESTGPEITVGGYGAMLELASEKPAVRIGKPAPVMFEMALLQLGLLAQDVLMVGDNAHVDTAGAKGVGIASALVRSGEYSEPCKDDVSEIMQPEYVITRVDEVLTLLN